MELKCIKGISHFDHVVCLTNDVVRVIEFAEESIAVEGVSGWCKGHEIYFSCKEIAECFSYWGGEI